MKKIDWEAPVCQNCFDRGHEAKDCQEDRKDFELIHVLAAFIAARLNYILPRCNSGVRGGKPVSTIAVDQHKEKFWYVRIYCELADPGLVDAKWQAEHPDDALVLAPTQEFKDKCLRADAIHYRNCYLDAVKLVPRLHRRIIAQADYHELLLADVDELHSHIDELAQGDPEHPNVNYLAHYLTKWHAKDAEELKSVLMRFYERPR